MSATNYVVTVQRPTAVTALATGYFTSPTEFNLIVAKNTHFEIYLITSEGLKLVKDVCIYGQIDVLKCFRLPNMNKDVLFIFTAKCHGMILDCRQTDNEQYEILTKCHGLLKDTGLPSLTQPLCTIDIKHGLILLRVLEGVIKLIYLKDLSSKDSTSKNLEAYNIKINEQNIIDIQFLPNYSKPTFIVLHARKPESYYIHGGETEEYFLQTYEIDLKERAFNRLTWKEKFIISEASFLIPIGQNELSCLTIARNTVLICQENKQRIELKSSLLDDLTRFISYCPIDEGRRYLLTDANGKLYLLILEYEENSSKNILDMKLNLLGEVSNSLYITYLDNSVAFVGSKFGDSQLIRLLPEPQNGSHVEILESYINLGPILDMCVIDPERQGRQLVTCSGNGKDSSLRFIRTGIGIHEHATIDLRNIKGIWSLKIENEYDNHLVVSFFDQTRLFQLQNDEIEEIELAAFDSQHQTLFCTNVTANQYIQMTTHSIRLIGNHGQDLLLEWKNSTNEITVATSNLTQCVCACGNELFYFEILQGNLKEINKCQLPYNIACLDITPLNSAEEKSNFCAIGLWTQISVWICRLPTLEISHKESLTSDTLPRSVAMINFDCQPYVFISLADGPIVYYLFNIEEGFLYERKKVPLGTKPTTLTICHQIDISSLTNHSSTSRTVLFACSDHPTVISSLNNKINFSSVNVREIVCMCLLNSEYYGSSLTLVTDLGILIGRIDDIEKLHVRSLILGESAKRLIFFEEENVFILLTQYLSSYQTDLTQPISRQAQQKLECQTKLTQLQNLTKQQSNEICNSIVIIDQHTHEARISVKLLTNEEATCLCSVNFNGETCIAIGTAIVIDEEEAPKYGRIVLYRYKNQQLTFLAEKDTNGSPYGMVDYHGKLVAAIGNTIRLFKFENNELVQQSKTYSGRVECLTLKIKDDFILYGDLMSSLTVLRYNANENKFEEIAQNPHPHWTLSCEFLDDDTFLSSNDNGNLISLHKNSGSTKEQERNILNELGLYHLGEQINIFRHGCLITQQTTESVLSLETCTLMGSISGYIGLCLQLPVTFYRLLFALQEALGQYVPSVGKIDHKIWRAFEAEDRTNDLRGFIDGDLIETYLDLPKTTQIDLIKNLRGENNSELNMTVEDVIKLIEELSRIH